MFVLVDLASVCESCERRLIVTLRARESCDGSVRAMYVVESMYSRLVVIRRAAGGWQVLGLTAVMHLCMALCAVGLVLTDILVKASIR